MRQYVIPSLVATAVSLAVLHFVALPRYYRTTVVMQGEKQWENKLAWGALAQAEIDALTAEMKKIESKQKIVIYCSDDNCFDMALDFDNAFESAKWDSVIERPLFDDTVGIASTSETVAKAVERATDGRVKVAITTINSARAALGLVIGRRQLR